MRGLILAGGSGSRLRPITHTGAKQLVPVANKPILFHGLEHMADAGITEVGIVVGDTADEVRAAVGDGAAWGLSVTYLAQEAPLGLAHAVLISRDFLGDEPFVMYLGDNLLESGLASYVQRFEAERAAGTTGPAPAAQIILAKVGDPEHFGVAEVAADGRVVRLVEKPSEPPSDLALVGVYLFGSEIHEAVRAIEPSARGELEITDAIGWLIDAGHRVSHDILDGWWIDTGKLTPLLEANRLTLEQIEGTIEGRVDADSTVEGRVAIGPGARVVASTVRGPAIIGPDTRIEDSYVGPFTSVDAGCEVLDSEIDHSIVLADSHVSHGGRIIDSLIGREAVVTRSGQRPQAARLMIGDHTRVEFP